MENLIQQIDEFEAQMLARLIRLDEIKATIDMDLKEINQRIELTNTLINS